MKKILIVGGSGYIGSVLIKSCIEKKFFVYNLDNKIYKVRDVCSFHRLSMSCKLAAVLFLIQQNHTDFL